MTLEELKEYFGNSNQFELKTGLSHVNWLNWFKRNKYIPIESQMRIEKLTDGDLKARFEDLPDYKQRRKQ